MASKHKESPKEDQETDQEAIGPGPDEALPSFPIGELSELPVEDGGEKARGRREVIISDPLERYLAEIRHLPTLSREEEHELAVRYSREGDKMAGYRLVLANLRLVVMIAREYQRNVQNILDLVQEGNIGLLEAVKQYDPFRGIRFPSYAVYWIRAYMLRYLINNIRLVKIGTTQAQRKLFFNLQKEKEKLEAEGFVPEAKLLAERLKVKESEVIEMSQRLALPDMSVDAPLQSGESDSAANLHGILADSRESAEEIVVEEQFRESLRHVVDRFRETLDEKERSILDERLMTEDPATLQDIADRFNLSRERIRQIENRLKERLKAVLANELQLNEEGQVEISDDESGVAGTRVIFLIGALCAVLGMLLATWWHLASDDKSATYAYFFERNAPKVAFPSSIPGIGVEPGKIAIDIHDDGAGIDEVIVRCDQDGEVRELLRKRYKERMTHDRVEVPVDGKKIHLNQGEALVEVSVFDKSFWSNGSKASFDFIVDYGRPKLSVVSVQHNAALGGAELVFYRLEEEGSLSSGVDINGTIFRGTPAEKLDSDFSSLSQLYFTYIAFPIDFPPDNENVHAFALDEVGNRGTASFYYRVARTRYGERKRSIDPSLADAKLAELLESYQRLTGETPPALPTAAQKFAFVNTTFRAYTEKQLQEILKSSADKHFADQYPIGPFLRQRGGLSMDFGETQRYFTGDTELGAVLQLGADFVPTPRTPVIAAENGRVVFAGELGIFGKTIVLDHGFGIATVYGYLSRADISVGDEVRKGDEISTSGTSGLTFDERIHFEVRIHGVPVRSIEWWDKHWLAGHFGEKVRDVKKALGIEAQESDESESEPTDKKKT